jgi:hypothetical protein
MPLPPTTTPAFEGRFTLVTTTADGTSRQRFRVDEAGAVEVRGEDGGRVICHPSTPGRVWVVDAAGESRLVERAVLDAFLQAGPMWAVRRWTVSDLPPLDWQGEAAVGSRLSPDAGDAPVVQVWTVPGREGVRAALGCLGATTAPAVAAALGARDGLQVRAESDGVVVTIDDLAARDEDTLPAPPLGTDDGPGRGAQETRGFRTRSAGKRR